MISVATARVSDVVSSFRDAHPSFGQRFACWKIGAKRSARNSTSELKTCPVATEIIEHPFGTLKAWMGYTHFQMKTLKNVRTEMALHVLAYNIKRVINIMGTGPLMAAIKAA